MSAWSWRRAATSRSTPVQLLATTWKPRSVQRATQRSQLSAVSQRPCMRTIVLAFFESNASVPMTCSFSSASARTRTRARSTARPPWPKMGRGVRRQAGWARDRDGEPGTESEGGADGGTRARKGLRWLRGQIVCKLTIWGTGLAGPPLRGLRGRNVGQARQRRRPISSRQFGANPATCHRLDHSQTVGSGAGTVLVPGVPRGGARSGSARALGARRRGCTPHCTASAVQEPPGPTTNRTTDSAHFGSNPATANHLDHAQTVGSESPSVLDP